MGVGGRDETLVSKIGSAVDVDELSSTRRVIQNANGETSKLKMRSECSSLMPPLEGKDMTDSGIVNCSFAVSYMLTCNLIH